MKSALVAATAAAVLASSAPAAADPAPAAQYEAAKDTIWTLEQSIYAGRAKGDISNYANNVAAGYLAWPPMAAQPMRSDKLRPVPPAQRQTQERLTMTFMDFTLHGDTAIIYYKTHRTSLADGTPVDQWHETTHTWVLEDGKWHVLGGMARAAPQR
jgi:hypothetical protein